MSKINDGGPAFAMASDRFGYHKGMSLRDAFAISAMAALMQMDGIQYAHKYMEHAVDAYKQADAMLKAREAGNE